MKRIKVCNQALQRGYQNRSRGVSLMKLTLLEISLILSWFLGNIWLLGYYHLINYQILVYLKLFFTSKAKSWNISRIHESVFNFIQHGGCIHFNWIRGAYIQHGDWISWISNEYCCHVEYWIYGKDIHSGAMLNLFPRIHKAPCWICWICRIQGSIHSKWIRRVWPNGVQKNGVHERRSFSLNDELNGTNFFIRTAKWTAFVFFRERRNERSFKL